MAKTFLVIAGALAALAVLLGAFGAHGLKAKLDPETMALYQTAVQYHMWHALGLAIVALTALRWPQQMLLRGSGWLMVLGIVFFSGSLYALALTKIKILGAITPLGGIAFIMAWIMFTLAVWKAK
ncbi:MAG: DUF423 domain-containing protein [Pseudomonadota bacterium]|nr:DUF423 domain-containing protein [Pseudomonadota bacterium]